MNGLSFFRSPSALVCVLAFVVGGCEVTSIVRRDIRVSPASARILSEIGRELSDAGAEARFRCSQSALAGTARCAVVIDGSRETGIHAEMINHPFEGTPMVYRLTGGSQEFQRALYSAVGRLAPTNEFGDGLFERVIQLDDKAIKFRCTATRTESPQYQCWTLISAKILD